MSDVSKYLGLRAAAATKPNSALAGFGLTAGASKTLLCTLDYPADGSAVESGAIVITGTISAPASGVAISLFGGSFLGNATVDNIAKTWTYTWNTDDTVLGQQILQAFAMAQTGGSTATVLVAVFVLVPLSLFTSGLVVDTIPGSPGDAIGVVPSAVGSNALTPSSPAPYIVKNAIGGNDAAYYPQLVANGYNYLSTDALAAHFLSGTASWTVMGMTRLDKQSTVPIFSVLRSDGDASEQFMLHIASESFALFKKTPGGGSQTLTGPRMPDPYSDSMWALRSTTGVITLHERAAHQKTTRVTTLGTLNSTALSGSNNRFTWGASRSSVPYEVFTGYQGKFRECPSAISDAKISAIFDRWTALNYTPTVTQSLVMISPGDSIMTASQDAVTGAGARGILMAVAEREALGWTTYGGLQAGGSDNGYGVGRLGLIANTFTSSLSGQDISQICAQAILDIANSPAPVGFWLCYMGGANNNRYDDTATIVAAWKAGFTAVMTALLAQCPTAIVSISPLIPLSTTVDVSPHNPGDTQAGIVSFHTAWNVAGTGLKAWAQSQYPGHVYACDMYAALTGVWTGTYFGDGTGGENNTAHPNRAGTAQMALHPTAGQLRGTNDNGETLLAAMRRLSPSAAKLPAFTGAITSPAPAAALIVGTKAVITATCSRAGAAGVVYVDGSPISTAVEPFEIYTSTVALGSYTHTPLITHQYSFTPITGDIGSHTIAVHFTDADGVTTHVTPSVSYTVAAAAPSTPMAIVTSVPTEVWYKADLGVTVTTGHVSAMADQSGVGNHLALNGQGPTVTATDATLSNLQTLAFTSAQELFAGLAHALVNPFTYYYTASPTSWASTCAIVGDSSNGFGRIADAGGSTPNVYQFAGAYVNPSAGDTLNVWKVYKGRFTGSTSDAIKVGSDTERGGANSGTGAITSLSLNPGGHASAGKAFKLRQFVAFRGVPTPTEEANLIAWMVAESASIQH